MPLSYPRGEASYISLSKIKSHVRLRDDSLAKRKGISMNGLAHPWEHCYWKEEKGIGCGRQPTVPGIPTLCLFSGLGFPLNLASARWPSLISTSLSHRPSCTMYVRIAQFESQSTLLSSHLFMPKSYLPSPSMRIGRIIPATHEQERIGCQAPF